MFSFIADILTSIASILFPVFASYKALRTSDPSLLAPWLIYWTTLSLFLLVESQLYFILYYVPFYSWFRLFIHLYLVLPGQQGSVYIYQTYIHPFLEEHERQIDRMISDLHAKAKEAGLDAYKGAWEYVRVNVLGQAPKAVEETPPASRNVSYSTYLMDRFAMPSARQNLASVGTSDIFSLIGKALQQTTYPTSTSREAQVEDLTQSGTLIPPTLSGAERTDFISTQRERLETLLKAFDREAANPIPPPPPAGSSSSSRAPRPRQPSSRKSYNYNSPNIDDGYSYGGMHQSRSETDFEDLAYEAMPDPGDYMRSASGGSRHSPPRSPPARSGDRSAGGGWSTWIWGNYGEKDSFVDPRKNR